MAVSKRLRYEIPDETWSSPMANAVGMIDEGLWRKDKDFQRLPRLAQCTFCQVLSQKDLDTAGIPTLHIDLLAKGCDELTVEQLRADFEVLEQHRFVFVDYRNRRDFGPFVRAAG